jgi:NAD kinase
MPEFNEIYCIVKRSELDYLYASDKRKLMFNRLSSAKRDQIKESHENQLSFIGNLKKLSEKHSLNVQFVAEKDMDAIHPKAEDLVLSCGGDGTFLSCAQKYENSILWGMNSDYQLKDGLGSYGALTNTNRTNLEERLKNLMHGDFFIDRWNRLQVRINGELVNRYAVNDIYFGQKISYQTCDILIKQAGQEQDFNCSGVLCCTGMGSHAWYYNAGGSTFSNELDAFGFLVLFPNLKYPMKFSSGVISSRNEIIMFPEGDDYIISFDSKPDVIGTQLGDEIRVSLAPENAVQVISFAHKEINRQ